jgi:hypothetical protein
MISAVSVHVESRKGARPARIFSAVRDADRGGFRVTPSTCNHQRMIARAQLRNYEIGLIPIPARMVREEETREPEL